MPLLSRITEVHRALRTVRRVRRLLLAGGASVATLVVFTGAASSVGVVVATLSGLATWWWLTSRASEARQPDATTLATAALWVEEQWLAERRLAAPATPDFALTTAAELLAAGAELPAVLASAAGRTLAEAPVTAALRRARREAWTWPAVFVVACTAILTTGALMRASRDAESSGGAGAGQRHAAFTAAITPLGAWTVRVQPPAYAALEARQYGDVNNVPALTGSRVVVSGNGGAPQVDGARGIDSTAVAPRVDARADAWRITLVANAGAQTVRVSRGGRARLFIVEGRPDSVPRVSLASPARDSVFRVPSGVLPLEAVASDDIGLTRAYFELIVTSGEGERFTVRTVLVGPRTWGGGAGVRTATLRGTLDLAALQLQAGDVIHLRAVARDAHPSSAREFGSSETRAFRIARPTEYDSVAVEPAPPPEVDKSLLSQRMLLMLTEKLDRAQRRMPRPDVLRESLGLARDQARLRLAVGDVVFQRLSGESSAEHAHTPGDGHDHGVEQQGGKLALSTSSTTGMLEEGNDSPVVAINQPLLEAYNAMWDAGRALEQGDPHGAIPPMRRALAAIERSRAASRLYLRGKPPQVIVDVAKVRLSGKDTGQLTVRNARMPLPSRVAARDARLVRAAALVPVNAQAARDSVALLRVEALADEPAFAAALATLLANMDRGGDATAAFVQARRVLGNVQRTPNAAWSRGVVP